MSARERSWYEVTPNARFRAAVPPSFFRILLVARQSIDQFEASKQAPVNECCSLRTGVALSIEKVSKVTMLGEPERLLVQLKISQ